MRIAFLLLFVINSGRLAAQSAAPTASPASVAAQSASSETLRLTVRAMIADAATDFSKYLGDQIPKKNYEKENEKNFNYKLSVGAKTEKVKFDPFMQILDLRLYFGSDDAQTAQAKKVQLVLDTMSARFERQPNIIVERKSGTVRVKTGNVTIFYNNVNETGLLTGLYIHSTSPGGRAQDEKNRKSYEANAADPADKESLMRLNFLSNCSSNRNTGNMGLNGILKLYGDALKAPGADPDAIKSAYKKKAFTELDFLENNYKQWEGFLLTAATLKPGIISQDKEYIQIEKNYAADMRLKLINVFR